MDGGKSSSLFFGKESHCENASAFHVLEGCHGDAAPRALERVVVLPGWCDEESVVWEPEDFINAVGGHRDSLRHLQYDDERREIEDEGTIVSLRDYPVLETVSLPIYLLLGFDPANQPKRLMELLPPSLVRLRLITSAIEWSIIDWLEVVLEMVANKEVYTPNLRDVVIRGAPTLTEAEDFVEEAELESLTEGEADDDADVPEEWINSIVGTVCTRLATVCEKSGVEFIYVPYEESGRDIFGEVVTDLPPEWFMELESEE